MSEKCGHTIQVEGEISPSICTLPKGHTRGHHDIVKNNQWWDRSDDYGDGAYASIHPGDRSYRHDFDECSGGFPTQAGQVANCAWCLQSLVSEAIDFVERTAIDYDDPAARKLVIKMMKAMMV